MMQLNRYTKKNKYKEVNTMPPTNRDASANRILTRLGTFLNNDVALAPM